MKQTRLYSEFPPNYAAIVQHESLRYCEVTELKPFVVNTVLTTCITNNNLQRFYPTGVDHLVNKIMQMQQEIIDLGRKWELDGCMLLDLIQLALYDVVLYLDDSGSMRQENRIADLVDIINNTVNIVTMFDDNGINVRFMNTPHDKSFDAVKNSEGVNAIVGRVSFNGLTPIGSKLQERIIDKFLCGELQPKPLLVITITDGIPSESKSILPDVIDECFTKLGGDYGAVRFMFSQVGSDKNAQDYLASLDDNKEKITGKYIDVVSRFDLEYKECKEKANIELTYNGWLTKLLLGAIDKKYDSMDEQATKGVAESYYNVNVNTTPSCAQNFTTPIYGNIDYSGYTDTTPPYDPNFAAPPYGNIDYNELIKNADVEKPRKRDKFISNFLRRH